MVTLSFSQNSDMIYSGSMGGTVHVWDLTTQKEIMKLKGHKTSALCLTEGSLGHGQVLISGSEDTNVKVWDLRMSGNQNIFTFKEHTGAVTCAGLSPDSKWVASGCRDGAVKVWEVTTGKVVANFFLPG